MVGAGGAQRPKCGSKIISKVVENKFWTLWLSCVNQPGQSRLTMAEGLKGPFVWTGQGVEGQTSPIHDTLSVATLAQTDTHPRVHFPSADLGEFNLGYANFSQRGQGWSWRLCGRRKGRERKTKRRSLLFSAACRRGKK